MIDLRSDTLTKPTEAMRRAMTAAPVGDDVYGEDPTINELEARTAELLGHQAGLFCPTGTMSNLLGVFVLVDRGTELLCDEQAHLMRAESGSHAGLHGITSRTWSSAGTGIADPTVIEPMISVEEGPLTRTTAIAVENTHNFGGGTIQPFDSLQAIGELCRAKGLGYHLDGARLWNAHVATGIALADYGRLFDTVSVCYSKGLGAPVGTVLISSTERIARARRQRRALGGAWRQAGILAAAALYALDHHVERLADDHLGARELAGEVADRAQGALRAFPQTNIVVLDTGRRPAAQVAAALLDRGVRVSVVGARVIRAVAHLDVAAADYRTAGRIIGEELSAR